MFNYKIYHFVNSPRVKMIKNADTANKEKTNYHKIIFKFTDLSFRHFPRSIANVTFHSCLTHQFGFIVINF